MEPVVEEAELSTRHSASAASIMTDEALSTTLSARLRTETWALHSRVERAGIMADLLHGRIERWQYLLLLRNLHPVYSVLDASLNSRHGVEWRAFPFDRLRRTEAIEEDLSVLHGPAWRQLPLVDATIAYTNHLMEVEQSDPLLLLAHAYLRHLGDLSGGKVLRERVGRMLSLSPDRGLSFYDFGDEQATATLGRRYRAALDGLRVDEATGTAIVAEAQRGFLAHERMFVELAGCPTTLRSEQ